MLHFPCVPGARGDRHHAAVRAGHHRDPGLMRLGENVAGRVQLVLVIIDEPAGRAQIGAPFNGIGKQRERWIDRRAVLYDHVQVLVGHERRMDNPVEARLRSLGRRPARAGMDGHLALHPVSDLGDRLEIVERDCESRHVTRPGVDVDEVDVFDEAELEPNAHKRNIVFSLVGLLLFVGASVAAPYSAKQTK